MKGFVAALLGLALGLALIDAIAPDSTERLYREVEQMRADCEVLFVGPSYVNGQVYPDVVDQAAREAGVSLSSCKFARMHLKGFEMKRELEAILKNPWSKLRLVVFDVTLGPDTGFKPENRFKPRVLRWHTWDLLPWYLEHLEGQRTGKDSPYLRLWDHVQHVVVNALLVGRGAERLAELSDPATPDGGSKTPGLERDRPDQTKQLRRRNEKRVAKLLDRRRRRVTSTPDTAMAAWVLELRSVVRAHGAEGDGLIAPVWSPSLVAKGAFPPADAPVVHAFDNPRKYPTLYELGMHKADEHLTDEGSREYSRLLGQTLAMRMGQLK